MTVPTPRRPEGDPPVVVLYVQRGPNAGIRLAAPSLPGWVASVQQPIDVLKALDAVLREAELAQYARARGAIYDAAPYAVPAEHQHRLPVLRAIRRQDGRRNWRKGHDPADWTPLPDGTWRSPGGLVYPPSAQVVQRVIALRQNAGIAIRHPDAPDEGDQ